MDLPRPAAQTPVQAAQTPIQAAQTPVQPAQTPIRAARAFLANVSIEPILFFYNFQFYAVNVIKENLKLDRFCRIALGRGEEECALINDGRHEELQVEVQRLDSVFLFYEKVVSTVVPILLMSFIASWSDRSGRKIPLVMSFAGTALYLTLYLLEALFPSWPPEVLLGAAFLNSLGGGWVMVFMASYSYMADKTHSRSRTFRMTVMNSVMHLGDPCGTAMGAWLFAVGGYLCVYAFSLLLITVCIVWTVVVIRDREPSGDTAKAPGRSDDDAVSPWNPRNVVDLFRVCFRRRPGRGRLHIVLLMTLMMGIFSCTPHNLYLWSRRVFLWDERDFSEYTALAQLVEISVMLASAPLIQRLRLHDCTVGAASTFLVFVKMLALGLLTSSSQWWVVYVFIVFPVALPAVADRGMISKLCDPEEVGRIFSMMAILEILWPLVDSALFTVVYSSTIAFYPSYEHLVGAAFALYVFSGFLVVRLMRGEEEEERGGHGRRLSEEDVEKWGEKSGGQKS
ncbi:proton-coupled folate transporter-like [Penaeus japonicus]|uniref:proton-coupled folate transporter-like n=1 Tax=Penaeus japonicus TaxID=27405 RepID=UPI001C70B252|nr:proton-coupled folate transporter-like [Penaeus japonicus]